MTPFTAFTHFTFPISSSRSLIRARALTHTYTHKLCAICFSNLFRPFLLIWLNWLLRMWMRMFPSLYLFLILTTHNNYNIISIHKIVCTCCVCRHLVMLSRHLVSFYCVILINWYSFVYWLARAFICFAFVVAVWFSFVFSPIVYCIIISLILLLLFLINFILMFLNFAFFMYF